MPFRARGAKPIDVRNRRLSPRSRESLAIMRHPIVSSAVIAALCLMSSLHLARADAAISEAPEIGMAVIDFDYLDTSGEAKDQVDEHQKRLDAFMGALRRDLGASGKYKIVSATCHPDACLVGRSTLPDLRNAAREAGAKILLTGGIHKQSTLVQWAKVLGVDVDSGEVVFEKLLTFRGDTNESWNRSASFIAEEITAVPALAAGSAPKPAVKLAVFNFELEDFSPGAAITAGSAEDATQLGRVTDEVRRLISQSKRYSLVDVSGADAEAAKGPLKDCNGCDAAIALKLGADQSMVGIVTRITRTDYAVTYKIRDARTGALISVEQSDLRVGADYSWNRGAASLIKSRLLKDEEQP
jgi:Protein of unknown function (DUF2380)